MDVIETESRLPDKMITSPEKNFPSLRMEVNDSLRERGLTGHAGGLGDAVYDSLEERGILPHLFVEEAAYLDLDRQGGISRDDLDRVINSEPGTFQVSTVLAARFAANNFYAIESANDGWLSRMGLNPLRDRSEINADEIQAYRRMLRPVGWVPGDILGESAVPK